MIPYKTFDVLFSVGPFHVQAWGTMVALGFLIGLWIIVMNAKKRGLDPDYIYALALAMLLGGIIGARLLWAFTEAPAGLSFLDYLNLWQGGMSWYGALILGFLAVYAYMKRKNLNLWKYLDVLALGLPLGMAIGRVGCYLIGDHLGKGTVMPWAILMYGQLTHPVILYEIILLLGIFASMMYLKDKKLPEGSLFGIYVMAYSVGRFFIDFLRADPTYYGLTIAQYISIALVLIFSAVVWRINHNAYKG